MVVSGSGADLADLETLEKGAKGRPEDVGYLEGPFGGRNFSENHSDWEDIPSLSLSSVLFSSSRYERCQYQRRLCVVVVRDLEEVGRAGDVRKGILTAVPLDTKIDWKN